MRRRNASPPCSRGPGRRSTGWWPAPRPSCARARGAAGGHRDKIVAHVLGAEAGSASRLGLRLRELPWEDGAAVAAFREAIAGALRTPPVEGPRGGKRWSGRYAARRIAWHALDHAWEIEDRSDPS